jgi:hypothetical protein
MQPGYVPDPYQQALYRANQNVFVPYGAKAGPLPKPFLKSLKLGLGIFQLVALLTGGVVLAAASTMSDDRGEPLAIAGMGILGLWYLCLFAYSMLQLWWSYSFWSWVPPEQRWTSMWKKYISPGMFIGLMFVPYFNIYWLFVTHLGIADVLERMRVQYPTNKEPAKSKALLALIGSMLLFPLAPIFQYVFQRHVESMATDMAQRMPGAPWRA